MSEEQLRQQQQAWAEYGQQYPGNLPQEAQALAPHIERNVKRWAAVPEVGDLALGGMVAVGENAEGDQEQENDVVALTAKLRAAREASMIATSDADPDADPMDELSFRLNNLQGQKVDIMRADFTPAQAGALLQEVIAGNDVVEAKRGRKSSLDSASPVLEAIGTDKLRQMYGSERPQESAALREIIERRVDGPYSHTFGLGLRLLAELHGTDVLGLREQSGLAADSLVARATADSRFMDAAIQEIPARRPGETVEADVRARDYSERVIRALGVPDDINKAFRRDMNERTMLKDAKRHTIRGPGGGVDIDAVQGVLKKTREAVEGLDTKTLRAVYDKCGIASLDYYSNDQLKRMAAFVEGDETLLERLRAGDVRAVFTDAWGDHNGASRQNSEVFEHESGNTLYFEINRPSDYYRYMLLLKERDIKPSSIVLSSHGLSGGMLQGPYGEGGFMLTNSDQQRLDELMAKDGISRYAMSDATGIARVAEEFMQDSKGIDDDDSMRGRRTFILEACEQGTRRAVMREQADGQRRKVEESSADTFTKAARNPKVDVYAGAASIVTHKTERGLRWATREKEDVRAIRHYIDEMGNVVTEEQDEIVLHKPRPEGLFAKAA